MSGAGLLWLARIPVDGSYLGDVLPGLLVGAFGLGMAFPAVTAAGVSGSTEHDAGLASAVLNTVQQLGGAVGLSVLVGLSPVT